jgi:hypothetical protein
MKLQRLFTPPLLGAALSLSALAPDARAGEPAEPKADARAGKEEKKKPAVETGIRWKVSPGKVEVFLDGKRLGEAAALEATEAKPGTHDVRLVNGGDETEFEVKVTKGQLLVVEYEFSE